MIRTYYKPPFSHILCSWLVSQNCLASLAMPHYLGAGLGACGLRHTENDYIAAISYRTFDTYPNPICGKNLRATFEGKSVVVKVVDRCADCQGAYDVDMSPIAFRVLATQDRGRLHGVQWDWTDSSPGPAILEESD
ncbi:RlpA-like double-psi beta-barrel-protein domain-containing protein-containing protein [Collybia nuda]|uniref:RlpA-like double-psi beta-barrel-protein domain-containing protein-containing protein n=1 Tax=Collybia nuda TaxID=64659 RepID=A0A9P6CM69_9AGAR|nr:RlpA-like double-psi beta-barrel-protein domain-containing protein-containing protein [Collybia nuda]